MVPKKFGFVDLPEHENQYGLIIVDEAHNYRNRDAYRHRNLQKIIDKNGNAIFSETYFSIGGGLIISQTQLNNPSGISS